jgi:hypothetical protein
MVLCEHGRETGRAIIPWRRNLAVMVSIVGIQMGVIMDLWSVVWRCLRVCWWRLLGVIVVTWGYLSVILVMYMRMIWWDLRMVMRDLDVVLRSLRDMTVTQIWTETWAIILGGQLVRGTQVF